MALVTSGMGYAGEYSSSGIDGIGLAPGFSGGLGGASHMNRVLRKKYFEQMGLVSLQERIRFLEETSS